MNIVYDYPADEYKDLTAIISFAKFSFSSVDYVKEEKEILQPQLEALGYTEIIWLPGEHDSFGPLSRVCRAFDKKGDLHWFFYG